MKRDFVTELIGVVSEVAALDASAQQRIEQTIRCRFGGQRASICASRPTGQDQLLAQINQGLSERKSVRQIAPELGIGRSTIYRMLGRKSPKADRR